MNGANRPSPSAVRAHGLRRRLRATVVAAAAMTAMVGCSTVDAGRGSVAVDATTARSSSSPAADVSPTASSRAASHPSPPHARGVTWRPEGSILANRQATYVATTDGGAVGLLWIDPTLVRFRLVPGRQVPEGGPALPTDNVPSTWVPRMVAAFNGGFLLKDRVGGYYYAHRIVQPLVDGLGALAITVDGRLTVGRWGRDLTMTRQTVAVRENLPLLVDGFRARTAPTDTPRTWGVANGGLWTANRSALGELPDGSLVYAYGHEVRPATMAAALVAVGVQRAMVLDMNKSWPGGFVYRRTSSGTTGRRVQPQEYHSPSVYFSRYTKDFVAVLRR